MFKIVGDFCCSVSLLDWTPKLSVTWYNHPSAISYILQFLSIQHISVFSCDCTSSYLLLCPLTVIDLCWTHVSFLCRFSFVYYSSASFGSKTCVRLTSRVPSSSPYAVAQDLTTTTTTNSNCIVKLHCSLLTLEILVSVLKHITYPKLWFCREPLWSS